MAVEEIANRVGMFYYWDDNCFGQFDKRLASVLVEVDLARGLLLELEVCWSNCSVRLHIDY